MIKEINSTRNILFIFILVGAIWFGLAALFPENQLRSILIIIFAFIFGGVFLWSLFNSLRRIYGNKGQLWKEMAVTTLNVFIFLITISCLYTQIGIVNKTVDGSPITYDFWLCLYYSIITFTSTGYGDFHPHGIGRVLASIHAVVGYLVLGIMASTGLSIIQWKADGSGRTRGLEEAGEELDID